LGISDCHKIIGSFLKTKIASLKQKMITYRSLKNLDIKLFNSDLALSLSHFEYIYPNMAFENLIACLISTLNKHAPLKKKFIRGNHNRFMNKELSKAIMKRSQLKSKHQKTKNKTDRLNYKKQRNLCKKLRDKAIKSDFQKSFANIKSNSKAFFDIIKPYLTNKGAMVSSDILLIEGDDIILDDTKIATIFNNYYTHIVENTCGTPPKSIADTLPPFSTVDIIIDQICKVYAEHPSIKRIKENTISSEHFKFKHVSVESVRNLLSSLDTKKATGIDGIPPLILKLCANVIAEPFTKIINLSIDENTIPSAAKTAIILPFFKKDERSNKKNYRPISILSSLSKIYGRLLQTQIWEFLRISYPLSYQPIESTIVLNMF